jgi:peptidoglycan/LPS O-acetylase OafA/YrhL
MQIVLSIQKRISYLFKNISIWLAAQLDDEKPKGTIAALDGVRAIACIMVVLYHGSGVVVGRWAIYKLPIVFSLNDLQAKGVTLFFLLSGFLLFRPYAQALVFAKSWPQARIFYMRRILRIVPGYYFALFALVFLRNPSYLQPHNWKTLFFFLTFLKAGQLNTVYWTLTVEFQYYMFLPVIALGIYGLTRLVQPKQRIYVVTGSLLAMVAWGIGTRYWGYTFFARRDAQTYLITHPVQKIIAFVIFGTSKADQGKFFEDFAVGMLLAVCYVIVSHAPRGEVYRRVLTSLSSWLWWLGIAFLIFAAWRFESFFPQWQAAVPIFNAYPSWANEFVYALAFGCCTLAILYSKPSGILKRFFEWTPLRWVGLISFSLYLWHGPLLLVLSANVAPTLFRDFKGIVALGIYTILATLVVISISFTLYVLIEKPGMHLSERLRKQIQLRPEPKTFTPFEDIPSRNKELDKQLDPEKTEPRVTAVLTKNSSN